MNKFMLISSVAAFSLMSGVAGAVTLKNTDKDEASVQVDTGGKIETIKLKSGESYDSKSKDVSFTIGKEKAVAGKGEEHFLINAGKIEQEKTEAKAVEGDTHLHKTPVVEKEAATKVVEKPSETTGDTEKK